MYEVWVSEHKYEDRLVYRGKDLDEARHAMNEAVADMLGSPPVFDQDTLCWRMIHPLSGLEFWKVEIVEVVNNAA